MLTVGVMISMIIVNTSIIDIKSILRSFSYNRTLLLSQSNGYRLPRITSRFLFRFIFSKHKQPSPFLHSNIPNNNSFRLKGKLR